MHPEPLLDDAAIPEGMQTLARTALRADVIAAPVVLGRSMEGLVDVVDPMAEELSAASFSSSVASGDAKTARSASIAVTTHSSASGHS